MTNSPRKQYLDNLRAFTVLLLFVYHTLLRGEESDFELFSVSVAFPAGIILHYVANSPDTDTEDDALDAPDSDCIDEVLAGPWLNKGLNICIEVGRGDSITPVSYHIMCSVDESTDELRPILHYNLDGIQYYMNTNQAVRRNTRRNF